MTFNPDLGYVTCGHCNGKFQATKQIQDPNDETGATTIDVYDDESVQAIYYPHKDKCTQEAPWLDDPNAFYS